jgi:hypothetical protein
MVKIVVGTSPQHFWLIHEQLLTSASGLAFARLHPPRDGQQHKIFEVREADVATFGDFINYLYTSSVDALSIDACLRLYFLALKLRARFLRYQLRCRRMTTWTQRSEYQLNYVLETTPLGDLLRFSCLRHLWTLLQHPGPPPISTEFGRTLCEKYSAEILAHAMSRYSELIMQTTQKNVDFDAECLADSFANLATALATDTKVAPSSLTQFASAVTTPASALGQPVASQTLLASAGSTTATNSAQGRPSVSTAGAATIDDGLNTSRFSTATTDSSCP